MSFANGRPAYGKKDRNLLWLQSWDFNQKYTHITVLPLFATGLPRRLLTYLHSSRD